MIGRRGLVSKRVDYLGHARGLQSHEGGHGGTEFQEVPAGDAFLPALLVDGTVFYFPYSQQFIGILYFSRYGGAVRRLAYR